MNPIFIWACIVAIIIIAGLVITSLNKREDGGKDNAYLRVRIHTLQRDVDHLATVQSLVLKQLNVEHQILPERDMLVPLDSFSGSKKSKEGSA